jgi:hypothetical protein
LDRAQKVGVVLFVTALVVLAMDIASSMSLYWFAGATFVLLLVLSGVALTFDFIAKRMKLDAGGKVLAALVLIGVVSLFFAPTIQTMPSGHTSGTHCVISSGCSSTTQIESVTNYLWCVGAEYQYSPPPATEFFFQFYAGCPPVA